MAKVSPLQHLQAVTESFPKMSPWVATCLKDKGKADEPDWPNWCFMPMGAWQALIYVKHRAATSDEQKLQDALDVGVLSAVGTWRYSQGIYRFDADLLAALAESDLSGELPSKLFRRLPEWCVYIETPGLTWLGSELYGFWAHMEWDFNYKREELRLVFNTDDGLFTQPLHLGKWSIEEALRKTWEFTLANAQTENWAGFLSMDMLGKSSPIEELKPLISILLYLCSDEPDFDPLRMPQSMPSRPALKKGKKGFYLPTPEKTKVFPVGGSIGPALRLAVESQVSGRTVKTHLRRGHWHGFWKGPRSGVRNFIYHWIAPLIVEGKKQPEVAES